MSMLNAKALRPLVLGTTTVVLFLALLSTGCRKNKDISTLSAENPFVYAYTSGVISKTDPIRVRFAQNVANSDEIGKEAPAILSISPNIKGTLTWEDANTLRLDPNQDLASGTTYDVSVNVKQVIQDAKGENANFAFQFHTREQHYQVDLEGMRSASATDYSKQSLKGAVYTADVAENSEVEKMLNAQQDGGKLNVQWNHSSDQLVHYFTVKSVNRGKQPSEVKLTYDGKAIGVKNDKSEAYKIPAVGSFTAMDADAVQIPEQYIRITFSDPLNKSQNLDGLITIDEYEGTLRYIIEDNTVRVYPDKTLDGSYRVRIAPGV
nr:Ig-like domain-containing protein [Haliscomenobacter sp.]